MDAGETFISIQNETRLAKMTWAMGIPILFWIVKTERERKRSFQHTVSSLFVVPFFLGLASLNHPSGN
jgi:hypothetical protein